MQPNEQEIAEAAQVFRQYVNMSEAERAAVINTGMFNSFIEAYLTVTLYSMNLPIEKIRLAQGVLKSVLDDTQAAEAVAVAQDILSKY